MYTNNIKIVINVKSGADYIIDGSKSFPAQCNRLDVTSYKMYINDAPRPVVNIEEGYEFLYMHRVVGSMTDGSTMHRYLRIGRIKAGNNHHDSYETVEEILV